MTESPGPSIRDLDVGPSVTGSLVVVRVWLTDRPGVLGQVASRIGAMRGDIIGVDVLERTQSFAIDEFAVALSDVDNIDLLIREIEEVDGASVEEWRTVERFPDPRLDALVSVDRLCAGTTTQEVLTILVDNVSAEFNLDWAAALSGRDVVAASGDAIPEVPKLAALAAASASPVGDAVPDDVVVAPLPRIDVVLLAGRAGHPFRRREHRQIVALARVAGRLAQLVPEDGAD